MADRIESFAITVPKSTAAASPHKAAVTFMEGTLVSVEMLCLPQHAGLVGWRFGAASTQIFPFTAGAWIVGYNETIQWDVDNLPETGSFYVEAYNTDRANAHTLYMRLLINELAPPEPPPTIVEPIAF